MIAWAGTRVLVAILTKSLMLMELRFVKPNGPFEMGHCLIAEGCGIKRWMAVNGGHIDGDRCEDRCVIW
jgi:hypothetical protein